MKSNCLVLLPKFRATEACQELEPTTTNFSWPSSSRKSIGPGQFRVLEDARVEDNERAIRPEAEQPPHEFAGQVLEEEETGSDSTHIREVAVKRNLPWTAQDQAVTPPPAKRFKSTTRERTHSQRSPRRSPLSAKSTNRVSKAQYGKRPNMPHSRQGRASHDAEEAQNMDPMLMHLDSGVKALHIGQEEFCVGMAI